MSTAASAPNPEPLPPRIGHHAWKIQIAAFLVMIVGSWVPPGTLTRLIVIPAVVAWMAAAWLQKRHDVSLCEACIAASPLDPQAEVTKHARALHVPHWLEDHRKLSIALFVVFAGLTLLPGIFGLIASTASVFVLGVLLTRALHVHHRLEPWCPECRRRGRGGKDYFDPDPTPTPAREKELT